MDYIAYYRVSTTRQGKSGLGLEAQRATVAAFLKPGDQLKAEYTESESGKRNDRPALAAAVEQATQTGATLLIAKLDRLSRNAAFIFTLKETGVSFVAADMPDANTMSIGVMAVMAQSEREAISERTRAALAAKKARGQPLGTPANLTVAGRRKGNNVYSEKARRKPQNIRAGFLAVQLHEKGETLSEIAAALNNNGFTTVRGNRFHPTSVKRLISRASSSDQPQALPGASQG